MRMRRLLVVAAAALAAVVLYTTTAPAGQQAVTPAQFSALTKKVTKLRKDLDATLGVLAGCVMGTAIPVSQYSGYQAKDQNGQPIDTTALDLTEAGGTPNGYALLVSSDPACLNLINSTALRKLAAFKPMLYPQARRPSFAHAKAHR